MKTVREELRDALLHTGAIAVGFAKAECVDADCMADYDAWLAEGCHASMEYLRTRRDLRSDPRMLLEGARTVISLAFPYLPPRLRDESLPHVARFAYGRDYHKVIPRLLRPVCRAIAEKYGATTRICVDSAPIMERYWALRAGVGRRGRNGTVIVDGYGSYIFLAEILTSLPLEPDEPTCELCADCGLCLRKCPAGALRPDGTVDAGRCLSYLSIESPKPLSERDRSLLKASRTLFGCDACQECCPHNRAVPCTSIEDFHPGDALLTLSTLDESAAIPSSPLRRALRTK